MESKKTFILKTHSPECFQTYSSPRFKGVAREFVVDMYESIKNRSRGSPSRPGELLCTPICVYSIDYHRENNKGLVHKERRKTFFK